MKHLFVENKYFFIPYAIFFLALSLLIALNGKAELHLLLNDFHTPFLDVLFKSITKIGEWVPYVIGVICLFYKLGDALLVLIGQLGAGLVTQILKRAVDAPRPKLFFAENYPDVILPVVEGVRLHSTHSFPSGHTTAIFAMFFALAIIAKRNSLKMVYILAAIVASFSRIYLSQHFAVDVLVGSFVGVAVVCVLAMFSFPCKKSWSILSLQALLQKNKKNIATK